MSIIDSQEPTYREEHEIDMLTKRIAELKANDGTRWFELFGTPERAARTLQGGTLICRECLIREQCAETPEDSSCMIMHYDTMLEWLRGDA